MEAMPLRVLDKDGGAVETHGLVVNKGTRESGKVVTLQVGARIGDQGKTRRMRLRKSVPRERCDRQDDLVLRFLIDALRGHTGAQPLLYATHLEFSPLESHSP